MEPSDDQPQMGRRGSSRVHPVGPSRGVELAALPLFSVLWVQHQDDSADLLENLLGRFTIGKKRGKIQLHNRAHRCTYVRCS